MTDRFGIGWRKPLAAATLAHLDRIDVIEVIADDYFDAPAHEVRALRRLAEMARVTLHGIGLGAASTSPVDERRVARLARLVDRVRPESWSEHLAFVRAGGIELGHLASPPRNSASVDGTLRNIDRLTRAVGWAPMMENVATLLDPPGSTLTEGEFFRRILAAAPVPLLLDLHNVHTNAHNLGYDAAQMVTALPLERVGAIHLAGGKVVEGRILDDHLHEVPDPVYDLLSLVAERTHHQLTVILERDGAWPSMASLLAQLDRARDAVARGRRSRAA